MGRGSSSSTRKSNERDAVLGITSSKKKAGTWEPPKPAPLASSIRNDADRLGREVEKLAQAHVMLAEDKVDKINNVVREALLRLTDPVKQMNVKDYIRKYGGNLRVYVDHETRRMKGTSGRDVDAQTKRRSATKMISRLVSTRSQQRAIDLGTSGSDFFLPPRSQVPSTPAHGTSASAANSILTVQAKKTPGGSQAEVLTLHIGDQDIDLTANLAQQFDSATKQTAANQLVRVQAQIESIISRIKPQHQ